MELELTLSQRNTTRTPSLQPQLTPCEQLKVNKAQLAKMETFRKCKQACVDALRQMPDHYPEEPFFIRALTELQDIEETMAIAVSDIDSFDICNILGCPHHEKNSFNSPTKLTRSTSKINNQVNNTEKGKDSSNFQYTPLRKTARKIVLDIPDNEEINLSSNKYALPQDVQLSNFENPGSVASENNPASPHEETKNNGSNNSKNQNAPQNQLPPPRHAPRREKLQSSNSRNY
ncbi:hypothetical protein TNCV_2406901 [Trichonephila clavipes]|nr:hypothetical protein TNCV_2406901 [Trichonephila clavipes]